LISGTAARAALTAAAIAAPTVALTVGPLASASSAPRQAALRSAPQPARPPRPNIIVVLIDDAGYADLSCYGNKDARTENIDRLAAEGRRFTQFYVNSPICSPSRAALLTGQYPARHRITSFIDNRAENERRGMAQFLDPKAPSLARRLSAAGYATGHFGKWHLGGGRDVGEAPLITEYGFDASLTQFEGLGDRVLPLMGTQQDGAAKGTKLPLGVASEKLGRGAVRWVPRHEVTAAFVERTLRFIEEARRSGKPFYVNVWPDDVHSPFDPPRNLRGDGDKHDLYEGTLVNMDRQLAPLFDRVRNDPALRDNTLILVLSDNGPEPGAGSAGTFRGHKGTLYEGGIREPLISWGPGLVKGRGVVDTAAVLSSVDLTRSLLGIAGAEPAASDAPDGEDLSAALLGKEGAHGRTRPLFWRRPPDRPGPPRDRFPDLAVRDGRWKLLVEEDGTAARLFDLTADPGEAKDVAAAHPDIVKRLREAVLTWNRGLPAGPGRVRPAADGDAP
jgi:uncharacterized sulfatase